MSPGDRPTALIVGGGGLLGSALCRRLAPDYDVVAVYRNRRPAVVSQFEQWVDPLAPDSVLEDNAHPVHLVQSDLSDQREIERVVDIALARLDDVDLLINNAAQMNRHPAGVVDGSAALDDLPAMMAFNVGLPLRTAVRLAQLSWRNQAARNRERNRSVVNVSSIAGSKVYPHTGQALYAASKAALNQLTRHLGAEFDTFGVRVNAVAPNSFPQIVSVQSVVEAIMRLATTEPVTGRILTVDAPPPETPEDAGRAVPDRQPAHQAPPIGAP